VDRTDVAIGMTSNPPPPLNSLDLVSAARRSARALVIAARIGDETAWMVSATRLRRAIARASAAIGNTGTMQDLAAATQLYGLTIETRTLRDTAPCRISGGNSDRVLRWGTAKTSLGTSGTHADLYDIDASDRSLPLSILCDLFLLRSQFSRAQMISSCFDNAVVDHCNLSCAVLRSSHWRSAQVTSSQMIGCDLCDATLDFAVFTDCDLRAADLSAVRRVEREATSGTMFVRCDLRNTIWDNRYLANVVLVDCRVHQLRGRPVIDGITIVRPDLSAAGDGSRIGSAADVLAQWNGFPDSSIRSGHLSTATDTLAQSVADDPASTY
jgi:Pentapeptide repeats (8 copies)